MDSEERVKIGEELGKQARGQKERWGVCFQVAAVIAGLASYVSPRALEFCSLLPPSSKGSWWVSPRLGPAEKAALFREHRVTTQGQPRLSAEVSPAPKSKLNC